MDVNSFLLLYQLLIHQSEDTCVLIRFISHFWSKIDKRGKGGCNENVLVSIFKNKLVAGGRPFQSREYAKASYQLFCKMPHQKFNSCCTKWALKGNIKNCTLFNWITKMKRE